MRLGYVVAFHGDGKRGPPFYTAYLEGLGGEQVEGQRHFMWLLKMIHPPPLSAPVPSHYSFRDSQAIKDKKEKT
jgi:hypothetical protein